VHRLVARGLVAVALVVGVTAAPGSALAVTSGAGGPSTAPVPTSSPLTPPKPKPAATPATRPGWIPLPARSGTGRRIVYSMATPQHVWVVDGAGRVIRQFKTSGRVDKPRAGTYRVFSKSARGSNPYYRVTFRYMIRFTYGRSAAIGFHSVPRYYNGALMHPLSKLGLPVGAGGCPHLAGPDARWLYSWTGIGTKVVVVR
jgi:lipoprotein-anchoring transpeptidase ErfK/SrfK